MDIILNSLNTLDIKQLVILEEFVKGNNVFMSGPGGTGKSYLINVIKQLCFQSKKKKIHKKKKSKTRKRRTNKK